MSTANLSRRGFLKTSGIVGGGLVVGFSLNGCSAGPVPLKSVASAWAPNAFVQITPDNVMRFYCPRDEMGQGVTTGLATLVAEDLDVSPERLLIELAGPHPDYNNPAFGAQGTGGSTSVKAHYTQLRQVGADVRQVLLQAAAQDLGVPIDSLDTDDGHIVHGDDRLPYGRFVATAAGLEIGGGAALKPPSAFKHIGREFPRLDALAKSTGTAQFGIDVDVPGMEHAVVVRCPVAGGTVKRFESEAARAMPGVTAVVQISSGVAVVAQKYWQAKQAAGKLEVEWTSPQLADVSSADMRAEYALALEDAGDTAHSEGDLEAGFTSAQTVIEQDYWAPYLSHSPMEPMNAVVHVREGEADVWSGTQGIGIAQGLVARYAGLDVENVRAHATYLGGGFGRRATLTHIIEATEVSVATGKPIHLLWSREDDIRHGVFRPASLVRIRTGVDDEGRLTAWQARRVGGNITPYTLKAALPGVLPSLGDGTVDWLVGVAHGAFDGWVVDSSGVEGLHEDLDVANVAVEHVTRENGLPLTFWRSVGHSYTAFAKETALDELAVQAGIDPIELRLRNTGGKPRLQGVIREAGARMQQMQPAPGRSLGFAAHSSFDTDVAEVAEVSVEGGRIRVHKVLCVVDCGIAVNPDVVRAQMEGAIMFGLTAALHGEHTLENGAVVQSNFHDYPILRMNEAPEVEVVIIESAEEPTGVGEPGLPPIAPAVANAVYAATGQRLRSLPLRLA